MIRRIANTSGYVAIDGSVVVDCGSSFSLTLKQLINLWIAIACKFTWIGICLILETNTYIYVCIFSWSEAWQIVNTTELKVTFFFFLFFFFTMYKYVSRFFLRMIHELFIFHTGFSTRHAYDVSLLYERNVIVRSFCIESDRWI